MTDNGTQNKKRKKSNGKENVAERGKNIVMTNLIHENELNRTIFPHLQLYTVNDICSATPFWHFFFLFVLFQKCAIPKQAHHNFFSIKLKMINHAISLIKFPTSWSTDNEGGREGNMENIMKIFSERWEIWFAFQNSPQYNMFSVWGGRIMFCTKVLCVVDGDNSE